MDLRSTVWLAVFTVACGGGGNGGTDVGTRADLGGGLPDIGSRDLGAFCTRDIDCGDGVFCNGTERCAPASPVANDRGCVSGTTPCSGDQTCNEVAQTCEGACVGAADADADGFDSIACGGSDCDDSDPLRFPGATEVCDPDNRDEDCNPATIAGSEGDADGDGVISALCCNARADGILACGPDCDDLRQNVNPSSSEVCDGFDNNCDGTIDEGVRVAGFTDADGDLHGDPTSPIAACPGLAGFSPVGDDCDDTQNGDFPGAAEVVGDARDNNCNGEIDEVAAPRSPGMRTPTATASEIRSVTRCRHSSAPRGYSPLPTDCDDTEFTVHPAATEVCDGLDNDCNGLADYFVDRTVGNTEDDDRDGFPDGTCAAETGMLARADCNDRDPTVFPGALELVDGIDNDCDGSTDGACEMAQWWIDADGDGWGRRQPRRDDELRSDRGPRDPRWRLQRRGDHDSASGPRRLQQRRRRL